MPINVQKKLEKLNKFMKHSQENIYEWTYYSKHALSSDFKYLDIYKDLERIVMKEFKKKCTLHNLGSRVMGIADEESSDLDMFVDIGKLELYLPP